MNKQQAIAQHLKNKARKEGKPVPKGFIDGLEGSKKPIMGDDLFTFACNLGFAKLTKKK